MSSHQPNTAFLIGALSFASSFVASAQLVETCSVSDNGGARKSAGSVALHGSLSQSAIQSSAGASGSLTLQAGYFACAILRPDLDTDGDGLADEVDSDNDDDGLTDAQELSGSEFDPQTATDPNDADSDDDGAGDATESLDGTNPLDPTANFRILSIVRNEAADEVAITWLARGGLLYELQSSLDLPFDENQLIHQIQRTATGGAAPWFETTETIVLPFNAAIRRLLYRVKRP